MGKLRGVVAVGGAFVLFGCGQLADRHKDDQAIVNEMVKNANASAAERKAKNEEQVEHARQREAERQAEKDRRAAEAREQNEREAREQEKACNDSRPERLADLKKQIGDFHAEMKKLAPHVDWISKHCKYEDTRGIKITRQRTADGVIIRTKAVGQEDDVTCNAPRPAGLTQAMVERGVYLDSIEADSPTALYSGEHDTMNLRCEKLDKAAGVDFFVQIGDFDAQKKILAAK